MKKTLVLLMLFASLSAVTVFIVNTPVNHVITALDNGIGA